MLPVHGPPLGPPSSHGDLWFAAAAAAIKAGRDAEAATLLERLQVRTRAGVRSWKLMGAASFCSAKSTSAAATGRAHANNTPAFWICGRTAISKGMGGGGGKEDRRALVARRFSAASETDVSPEEQMFRRRCSYLLALSAPAYAEVVRIEVKSRADVLAGKSFGSAGPYEKLSGTIYFAVDPRNSANQIITDIDKAPKNAAGKVEFSSDFYLIKPKDATQGQRHAAL